MRKKSFKGKLVKKYWEHIDGREHHKALGTHQRGRGIYILYDKNGKVYYAGISTRSLRGRIRKHWARDRHKGKWSSFSFYQIGRERFIKDIETLLLRVYGLPKGNRVKGRLLSRYNLAKRRR